MSNDDTARLPGTTHPPPSVPPELPLDKEKYRAELAEFDLTDAQRDELLSALWSIMCHFVRIRFDVARWREVVPLIGQISDQADDAIDFIESTEREREDKPPGEGDES